MRISISNRFVLVALALHTIFPWQTGCTVLDDNGGAKVYMDFRRTKGLYDAPFPSDDLQKADGRIDTSKFPNPDKIKFVASTIDIISREVRGFGATSGIFFQLSAAPNYKRLPDVFKSVEKDSPVFLIGIDSKGADYLKRYPIDVSFQADGGPFGSPNLLSLLPLQGIAMHVNSRYAAVVRKSLGDSHGRRLASNSALDALVEGRNPAGMESEVAGKYRQALGALRAAGVSSDEIAGLAVFTTGEPTAQMGVFRDAILALPLPQPESAWVAHEVFDAFCVFQTTIRMPVYQKGTPPFTNDGGGWVVDANGKPVLQGYEEANLVATIPRSAMPANGYPLTVMSRTGGGGERPLVDRGVHAEAHGAAVTPGSGPALEFARAGFAGLTADGPHGWLRNVSKSDEQVLMFNVLNPVAMRDNVRQSALELILLAHIAGELRIDVTGCAGASGGTAAKFDTAKLALMGHSMGATIAQPVLAFEPMYKALILSGSGASWLYNLVYKLHPLDVRKVAELLLTYGSKNRHLDEFDPVVHWVQWAGEASDAPLYNRMIVESGRNILMFQGMVDHYILPPIANASSLSLELDLAAPGLDAATAEVDIFRPLEPLLIFSGRSKLALPIAANDKSFAKAVVQIREDGIEDGHEVMYQLEAPKQLYRCFLKSFAAGKAVITSDCGI